MTEEIAKNAAIATFEKYYHDRNSGWGGNSGPGSHTFFTTEYRAFLSKFLYMNTIRTVVDIGCGDWQFSRYINFEGVNYLGLDIVQSIIDLNNSRFRSPGINFSLMPPQLSTVPRADLLIMKDVLQHLSNVEIMNFRNEVFPKFRFVLLTNSYEKLDTARNIDIQSGSFRCLDLTGSPYHFNGCYVLDFGSSVWERIRTFLYMPK